MAHPHKKSTVHGWLVLDKTFGLTSTQALGKARRLLGGRKAGHGGTLDPLATGILPIAFGEATKLIPYVVDGDKEYEFTVRWGEARTTDDSEGTVTATSAVRPTQDQIRAILPRFIGLILQKPPAFSALKIQGERAYDLARAGAVVDLPPREVTIFSLDFLDAPDALHARFRVACGKGMYVRSLARNMAEALGTRGHVCALRRTKVGPFTLNDSVTLKKLEAMNVAGEVGAALLPLKAALGDTPSLAVTPQESCLLRAGQPILIRPPHEALLTAPLIFAEESSAPVALIEPHAGTFRVLRGFSF